MTFSEFVLNIANEHAQVVSITVFVAVLCLYLVIGNLLEENRWVNESITALLIFTYYGVTMDPVNATMVTITIIIVLFSTIVFGFLTKPLISYLLPRHANNSGIHREPTLHKEELGLPLLSLEESAETNTLSAEGSLSMLIEMPVYTIHYYWRKFDNTYMTPIFGGPESF